MTKELSVSRTKDREAMALRLERIVKQTRATICRDTEFASAREIKLRISAPRGLAVTIDLDGDSRQQREGVFVMAWGIFEGQDRSARLSDEFGRAAGGPVNASHRSKCTAVSYSFESLCMNVEHALSLADDESAFMEPTQ